MSDNYGVIFDVDGVLVDSYQAHYESYVRLGRELGFEITEAQFLQTFGRTTRESIPQLGLDKTLGLGEADVAAFDDRKEQMYRDVIAADFPAMDGAVELIDALHAASFRLAVGSSGPPENVGLVIEKLDREASFSAKVTGNDVTLGKPHPEVFLTAAERLGLPPSQCLVVEDAAPGVQAALAAGMACIGLASTGHTRRELVAATVVVDSLREVTPIQVRELIGSRH